MHTLTAFPALSYTLTALICVAIAVTFAIRLTHDRNALIGLAALFSLGLLAVALLSISSPVLSLALLLCVAAPVIAAVSRRHKQPPLLGDQSDQSPAFTACFGLTAVAVLAIANRAATTHWAKEDITGVYVAILLVDLVGIRAARLSWDRMAERGRAQGAYDAVGWKLISATVLIVVALVGLLVHAMFSFGLPYELSALSTNRGPTFGWTTVPTVVAGGVLAILGACFSLRRRRSPSRHLEHRLPAISICLVLTGLTLQLVVLLRDLSTHAQAHLPALLAIYFVILAAVAGIMYSEDMVQTTIRLQLLRPNKAHWMLIGVSGAVAFLALFWAPEQLWWGWEGVPLPSALTVLAMLCGVLLTVGAAGFTLSRGCPREAQVTGVSATSAYVQAFVSYLVVSTLAVWGTCVLGARFKGDIWADLYLLAPLAVVAKVIDSLYRFWVREHNKYLAWEQRACVRPRQLATRRGATESLDDVHQAYLRRLQHHLSSQHYLVGALVYLSIVGPFAMLARLQDKYLPFN